MKKSITGILTLLLCFSITLVGFAANNISFDEISEDISFIESDEMIAQISSEDFEIVGFTNLENTFILNNEETVYFVESGDSLYRIAQRFNTSIDRLREINYLTSDVLYVGQKLLIPAKDSATVYFVERGDSLYKIARKFNTTIEKIKKRNNLISNELNIGQKLFIPAKDYQPGKPENPYTDTVYYVEVGDSLYKIARKFNTTIEMIRARNNLTSDELYVGQTLIIPAPEIRSEVPDIVLGYTVELYDNLTRIARKFNISAQQIKTFNNLQTDWVSVGQEISIPLYINEGIINKKYQDPVSREELKLLARAVYSEARGEPFKGQVAVAEVILNRVRHPFFPDTITEVIFQPWQFTAIHDGQFWLEPSQMAYLAVEAALGGWDPTSGAIYYYNPDTATSDWVFYRNIVIKIGNHYFAV